MEKEAAAKQEYKDAVQEARTFQEKYFKSSLPSALHRAQQLQLSYASLLSQNLSAYGTVSRGVPARYDFVSKKNRF